MGSTSRWCISEWKRDINHGQYQKVVLDTWGIANLFYAENDTEWIEALESIIFSSIFLLFSLTKWTKHDNILYILCKR